MTRLVIAATVLLSASTALAQPVAPASPATELLSRARAVRATSPPRAAPRPAAKPAAAVDLPEGLKSRPWGLSDVLDVALSNHPSTRAAWFDARAAAARLGVADAAYYPRIGLDVSSTLKDTHRSDIHDSYGQATWGGTLGLSWLILDFGAREANSAISGAVIFRFWMSWLTKLVLAAVAADWIDSASASVSRRWLIRALPNPLRLLCVVVATMCQINAVID